MQRSDKRHRLPVERIEGEMLLQKKGAVARSRRLTVATVQDDRRGDRMRVRFSEPARIAGTALLSVEDSRGDDEQWLYLPAFRKVRRVGKAELGDRFAGTDFFFEDLKRRRVEDFSYHIVGRQKLDGHACWVIESRPRAARVKKESPYGKSTFWLRQDNLFVVRARHYDRWMRPLKEVRSSDLRRARGRTWRANRVSVVDIQRNHRTVLTIVRRTMATISPQLFSKHRLSVAD